MNYKIYQPKEINFFVDEKKVQYEKANYNKVYEGQLETDDLNENIVLEKLFEKFNIDRPEDFKGHSMSTGDIVVLGNVIEHAYICCAFGWKKIVLADTKKKIELREDQVKMVQDLLSKTPEGIHALAILGL